MSTKFLPKVRLNKLSSSKDIVIKQVKPTYGSCILLMTGDQEFNLNLIKSDFFNTNFIRIFFQNRFVNTTLTRNQMIKTSRDVLYDKILSETNIKRTVKVESFIRGFTHFYDVTPELQFIDQSPKFPNFIKKIQEFQLYLKEMIESRLKTNDDLTLIFPSFSSIVNPKTEKDNLSSAFLFETLRQIPTFLTGYPNVNLLIVSKNLRYFSKIDIYDERGVNLIRLRSIFKTINNIDNNTSLDSEDVSNMSSTDNEIISDKNEILDTDFYVLSNKVSKNKIEPDRDNFTQVYDSPLKALVDVLDFSSEFISSEFKGKSLKLFLPKPIFTSIDSIIDTFKEGLKGFKLVKVKGSDIDFINTTHTKSSITKFEEIDYIDYLKEVLSKRKIKFPNKKFSVNTDSLELEIIADSDSAKLFLSQNLFNEISKSLESRKNPSLSLTELEVDNITFIKNRIDELIVSNKDLFSNINQIGDLNDSIKDIVKQLQNDQLVIEAIDEINQSRKYSGRRILEKQITDNLEAKQVDVEIKTSKKVNETLKDHENELHVDPIDIDVTDKSLTFNITDNLNSLYMSQHYMNDLNLIIKNFNKSTDQPIFVESAEIFESSNEFDFKQTLEVKFNIPNSKPQVFRLDIPKFTADGYLYLNGGKKFVTKQFIPLPIIKIKSSGEDVVQFSTNYNKTFIGRMGSKITPTLINLIKLLKEISINEKNSSYLSLKLSDSTSVNIDFTNSIEYNEIQKDVLELHNINTDDQLIFNRKLILELINQQELTDLYEEVISNDSNLFPIGINSKRSMIYFMNSESSKIFVASILKTVKTKDSVKSEVEEIYPNLSKMLLSFLDDKYLDMFSKYKVSGKFMYSYTKIVNRKMPLIVYLGYMEGLDTILDSYSIKTEFSTDNISLEGLNRSIKFKDGYLHFDDNELKNSLLLSGLLEMDTKSYNLDQFNKKGSAYLEYFADLGVPNLGKALENFYELFIDPITKDVLKSLDLPTDMRNALLYCNTLLQSSIVAKKNNITNYRLRGAETINGMLYKILADTVRKYRNASGSTVSSVGLTVKSNMLLQELAKSPIIEPVSTLNPVEEAMNRSKATYKGFGGSSFSHARGTEEIRAVDPSMNGIIAPTSTDDNKVGITRYLSMNPIITSTRGFISSDKRTLNASNKLNIAEMLAPFTPQHADPARRLAVVLVTGTM